MDRFELAWAAGFFDGEGWANAITESGRRTAQPYAQINQADSNGVPEVLLRFQRAVGGLGRISGPQVTEGREDLFRWVVSSRGDVELVHHLLLPWLGQVKLNEFASAIGRHAARSRRVAPSDEWRAWSAGLWDGEGSVYLLDHRSHEGYQRGEARITQSSRGGTPEVLARFLVVTRVGRLYGPYDQHRDYAPVYRWNVSAQRDIESTISAISPWIGPVKGAQATEVLSVLRAQAPLPRGRPDWGNRKTHCIRGHEYATARLRPYKSRGGGMQRRDSKQCLVCVREQARARREQKKRSAADDDRRSISDMRARYLLK